MRRLLPFPLLAATLFAMWVLLTDFSPGHILFAVVVALAVPRVMLVLQADRPRIRLGMAAARLAARVLADIVRSNIAVARLVLEPAIGLHPVPDPVAQPGGAGRTRDHRLRDAGDDLGRA
jgi:multisubunit Na+/H+ antiporter MnhE subunit